MILSLVIKGLARGKARFACAVLGVAVACGAVVFMFSLSATNAAQAPALAKRAVQPWNAWSMSENVRGADAQMKIVHCTIDYRPGGRVLQGPPMRATIAAAPEKNPYDSVKLEEGRWVGDSGNDFEIVCTRTTLRRFGRGIVPPTGTDVKFVGREGTMTAKIVGYLSEAKLPPGWPGVFANKKAFDALEKEAHSTLSLWKRKPQNIQTAQGKRTASEERGMRGKEKPHGKHIPQDFDVLTAESEPVVSAFKGDEQRRMDYARPLMLIAAVLTALSLLVNSLLLSVESNRVQLATLRTIGMTGGGVLSLVAIEAFLATSIGFAAGCAGAVVALVVYVGADGNAFPEGPAFAWGVTAVTFLFTAAVGFAAVLFALRSALSVKPLDANAERPHRRRRGMMIAFACGFAAFVAVEVWGASLMRGFVPSAEWPDAIVSVLPEGVSAFDVEKLRKIPGVERISELYPLQLDFEPQEELPVRPGMAKGGREAGGRMRRKACRNALFLAAEWLPEFRFSEGTHEEAERAVRTSDACVISEMISRSRNLHVGDKLKVVLPGRGPKIVAELPVAAVADVNWHMVTSRGLVRGMNGAPVMTDGPVFVSFDTIESLDARPAMMAKMTHLWVEYKHEFLKEKGVFPAGRAVEAAIASALGNPTASTVRLHARDEIADGTLAHGSDLIGQAARVPFVFLAILALGFIAMLVADADASRREFAVLRAVGATKAQLTFRLARNAIVTALRGIVAGLPVGALAGWLTAVKTAAIWPGMPHYFEIPMRVIAEGTAGALVFVLIVALPTALVLIGHDRRLKSVLLQF